MVSDSEPRYRLVDSNGNVVGSLFAESDGTLKLQEGTSGSDNELAFGTDGSLSVNGLSTERTRGEEVSRSYNTSYQNQTGHDIALLVVLENNTGAAATVRSSLYQSPNDTQEFPRDLGDFVSDEGVPDGVRRFGQLYVPDGQYYYINDNSPNEFDLHAVVRREVTSSGN